MAVLSGYLYYGWSIFQTRSGGCLKNFLGITFVCLVLLTCVVEKHTLLWTFYLKYKAFVDFPLSLILPLVVWLFKRQKDFNYQEKTEKDKEERKNIAKYKNNKQVKYFAGITLLIFLPILFP